MPSDEQDGRTGRTGHGRQRTTIYDIAQEAGVAASTVSRALSRPERVSAGTREHIHGIAERLGYRTNPLARAGSPGRTQTLVLLVADITNPHFFGIIRGAEHQARAAGCTLIVGDTEEAAELEARSVQRLGPSVDGFVIAASRMPDTRIRELAESHRLTLVNREVDGVASVIVDYAEGTRQIVEHLASLGYQSVTYLMGPRRSWLGVQRWRALTAAARRFGLSATKLGPFQPSVAGGGAAADAALGSGAITAVAHNDLMAIGMLRRFAQRGVRVPEDLSLVGYDDIFGADFCSPSLTTLAGPYEEAGRTAVDILLGVRDQEPGGPPRGRVVLPSHLVIRNSTGPAPGSGGPARPRGAPRPDPA